MKLALNTIHLCEALELLAKLPSASIELPLSDPDYGVGKEYDFGIVSDNPLDHWRLFRPVYEEMRRVTKPGHPIALFQARTYVKWFPTWFGEHDVLSLRTRLGGGGMNVMHDCIVLQTREQTKYELSKSATHWLDSCFGRHDNFDGMREMRSFIPFKSVDAMRQLVRMLSNPGDTIIDPFACTATTGVACILERRNYILGEWHPPYYEIARKRLAKYRERKAWE
jgi:DNA modification methylase